MKWKNCRKIALLTALIFFIPILSGSIFKEPELLDKDKKLIDLSKAIDLAAHGGNSFSDSYDSTTDDTGGSENTPSNTSPTQEESIPDEREIVIRISGTDIAEYDGKDYKTGSNFSTLITRDSASAKKVTFVLVDDYADSKVYHRIKSTFKSNDIPVICKDIEEWEQSNE